jgi:GPH family glycoside/pentoside/hexuronide:cation symporter
MVILGIVCAAIIFVSSFYIKENKYTILEEPLPIFKGIKQTFKNKPFLIFEISNFAFLISSTILITAVFYYITFILKLSGLMAIIPILLFFVMVFAFTPIYAKLVSRYGLKKVYIFSLVFSGLGFLLFFFIGWVFITSIIALSLVGIGFSGIFLTSQAVFAEIIDHDEILTEKRRETTYSGMNALLTKPAISIANGLFLLIIAFYGFQRASQAQTESAQMGIMIGFTIVPAIFILISALAMKFFPLDGPDWNKQKVELKKIHEEKEKEYLEYLKKHNKL